MNARSTVQVQKSRRRSVAGAIAVICAVGALAGWMHRSKPAPAQHDAPPAQVVQTAAAQAPLVVAPAAPSAANGAPSSAPPPAEEIEFANLPKLKKKLFADHPELEKFSKLHSKILRSESEREDYQRMLSDPKRLAAARRSLSQIRERELDETRQLERMIHVDYFAAALSWRDNPQRAELIDAIVASVKEENIDRYQSDELRKSVAADKMELVHVLVATAPSVASNLARETEKTKLGPLVAFAEERGKGLEAKSTANGAEDDKGGATAN